MALIVFLRGVNVGGHRTFRPSILARELSDDDVMNVGAAGTFVVRKRGSRAKFRSALLRKLPFEAELVLCDGLDLIRLEAENPFAAEPLSLDVVRFVSILSKPCGVRAHLTAPCTSAIEHKLDFHRSSTSLWLTEVASPNWVFLQGCRRSAS